MLKQLLFLLLCLAPSLAQAQDDQPDVMLTWSIANSSVDVGSTRAEMRGGWAEFIDDYVEPGVAWARAGGLEPAVLIMHPFGQYATQADDAMHLDGYDYAKAANAKHLTSGFATSSAWRSITSDVDCYAYLGGCHLTARLRDLPPAELRAVILRNLKPIYNAGFKGVYIDYAENAVTHPFTHPSIPAQSCTRSVDAILLEIADDMFPEDTGVEAAPRNFAEFAPLWPRNCIAFDEEWRYRFGGFTNEQCTQYGYRQRNTNHAALGYVRNILEGHVSRVLLYDDDPTETLELAQFIHDEGDIPAFNPLPFIQNDIPASELTD